MGFLSKKNFISFVEKGVIESKQDGLEKGKGPDAFTSYVLLPEKFKYKPSDVSFLIHLLILENLRNLHEEVGRGVAALHFEVGLEKCGRVGT